MPVGRAHADGQVNARLVQCPRGTDPSARKVERIPWRQHGIDECIVMNPPGGGFAVTRPWLRREWIDVHRPVNRSAPVTSGLQREHVVNIVAWIEAAAHLLRDASVGLSRMAEVIHKPQGKVDEGLATPVQPLQH